MDTYLWLVYLLFALAIVDLIVGVSNDAVNFLNSAIGSKVANIRTIMIIASVGILLGTIFSNGMMEVARKGVFNPGFFSYENIMVLFLAVMLTDILLLDFYNSIGLPTSTTVSIVFELLGAAFVTGYLVTLERGDGVIFENYMNFSKASEIIGGIFLSVLIAFTAGVVIQYFVRLVFTFNLNKSLKSAGGIFGGLAITAITYFLLIKGVKNSTLLDADRLTWIKENTLLLLSVSFVGWTIITQLCMMIFKVNPLKVVVLMGTFSLAMAFAGNDLVNFIGVAVAGWQSFQVWSISGVDAGDFYMTALEGPVATNPALLLGAGAIMVVTLWFSKKARKVTETEVSLGRQGEGEERFRPNIVSRVIVGSAMSAGKLSAMVPESFKSKVSRRFDPLKTDEIEEKDQPAFDLLRASVNLMMASVIIANASSYGLPLSTTYVSFMVAMGTSLSDRAWGRESAVYRVAGVLNVIGGWIMTALIAFVASGIIALILFYTGAIGAFSIAAAAAAILVGSSRRFKRKEKAKSDAELLLSRQLANIDDVIATSKEETVEQLAKINELVSMSIRSLVGQNGDVLGRNLKILEKESLKTAQARGKMVKFVRKMGRGHTEAGRLYINVVDLVEELQDNGITIAKICKEHVNNHHRPPSREFLDDMLEIERRYTRFAENIRRSVDTLNFTTSERIAEEKRNLLNYVSERLARQIELIQEEEMSGRLGTLQTTLLLETKDMIAITARIMKLYTRYAYRPINGEDD